MKTKTCGTCGLTKELNTDNFCPRKYKNKLGYRAQCRDCYNTLRRNNPKYAKRHSFEGARKRALERDIGFNITLEDLEFPDTCPVLGIQLEHGNKDWKTSPSIDRIDNSKGYVKGNVIVVSSLANSIKNCATWQQVMTVAEFYRDLEELHNDTKEKFTAIPQAR